MTLQQPSALLTDLYQLTMLQGYLKQNMQGTAVFEFFVRKLPANRNFLMAAGLEQALDYLAHLQFNDDELAWLAASGRFDRQLIDYLADFRFTGTVDAVPEGTVMFPDEPLIRVMAPLPQAQLVETRLINLLNFETVIASKAIRMVLAAPDKLLVDFGLRRAHGAEAGLLAARAAYLAGFAGSATLEAERAFGIPSYGTVAHSFIQAHDSEREAFLCFARLNPKNTVLLIDTYDTEAAARLVVELAPMLAGEGIPIRAVRLDSGDLGALAKSVRAIFDQAGLRDIRIFASGGLDEYALRDLLASGAPIDGFGVGTALTTSDDAPNLDCAYKLQEYAGVARRKRSAGKATWPGRKQVFRKFDAAGRMAADVITLADDRIEGEPLLRCVMRDGRRTALSEGLDAARARVREQTAMLPEPLRALEAAARYQVDIAAPLKALAAEIDHRSA
jgi:nicotinate phosphoribosyltransferase